MSTGHLSETELSHWADACLAADLFTLLRRLNGQASLRIRAQAGPVRDAILHRILVLNSETDCLRLPLSVSLERLIGGLDLARSLSEGRKVLEVGLLEQAHAGLLVVPSGEGLDPAVSAQLCMALDSGSLQVERDGISARRDAKFSLVVFDEAEDDEIGSATALTDRMDLHIDLHGVSCRAVDVLDVQEPDATAPAGIDDTEIETLCGMACAFGLGSLRPAMQAVRVARAHAAHFGRSKVGEDDVLAAVRLSLVQRATAMPQPSAEQPEEPADPPETEEREAAPSADEPAKEPEADKDRPDAEPEEKASQMPPLEMVLEALAARLPAGLLEQMKAAQLASRSGNTPGRSGQTGKAATRGRPLTSRRGELRSGKRLDLLATLRAAAPWQQIRARQWETARQQKTPSEERRMHIRPGDFFIRRYKQKSASTAIFVVDASGSTALNRLAETKGAIEILLAESYARRDHVGMISVRGSQAETALAPTRSLLRAKRSLAALPGGGGTPLASGLQKALLLAQEEKRRGRSPSIIVMTDGSANVGLDGKGGRPRAMEDALAAAQAVQMAGVRGLLLDVGRVPQARAQELSAAMGAVYLPMPFASSRSVSDAVRAQAG